MPWRCPGGHLGGTWGAPGGDATTEGHILLPLNDVHTLGAEHEVRARQQQHRTGPLVAHATQRGRGDLLQHAL